jgi:L-asparaginase
MIVMTNVKKRVLIVHTGGTLGMSLPERTRLTLASPDYLARLLTRVPELEEIADIDLISPWNMDSSDMGPVHWQELANLISQKAGLEQPVGTPGTYDGVVIIHGTDTLAFTASALAYMFRNLDRPIVLTGSQRPLEAWRTDARANLAAAVETATRNLPEVVVAFDSYIFRGCRSIKWDATSYAAFDSPNLAPLGQIGINLTVNHKAIRQPQGAFRLETNLNTHVIALTMLPGFDPFIAEQALLNTDPEHRIRAAIVRGFGVGNVPTHGRYSIQGLISSLREAHIDVVVTTQAIRGGTDPLLYHGGRILKELGVIGARDMTFEAAVSKVMWGLGQPQQTLTEWFETDLSGEATF